MGPVATPVGEPPKGSSVSASCPPSMSGASSALTSMMPDSSRGSTPSETVEAGAPSQCFALFEESDGRRQGWSGGALRPGRTLIAVHQAGDTDCKGRFSHFTVAGGSAGAGHLELATWDPVGRPGHSRQHRWERGFAQRTLGVASIDHPTMAPAGVRIRVLDGSFDPANICFKSY